MYTHPPSLSQVLRRDKHDRNKGCPFLGSVSLFSPTSFLLVYLPRVHRNWQYLGPWQFSTHTISVSVNNYSSVHVLLLSVWILFSDELTRINVMDAAAQVLPNQSQQPGAGGRVERRKSEGIWYERRKEIKWNNALLLCRIKFLTLSKSTNAERVRIKLQGQGLHY